MEKERLLSMFFPNFQNQDEFFERITREENAAGRISRLYLLLVIFSFCYGIIMGSYHGFSQAIASGVKVPILFSLALLICFPAFLIIQYVLGSRLRLSQVICVILSGFVLTASIMLAFAPVVILFQLTGGYYYFLILLHIGIWAFSGFFGMKTVVNALKFSCEKKNVYPHTGVVVFRFWVVILAFVGIQLAWNLRPFLGNRREEFKLFRKYEGNFYTAVIYSFRQLAHGDNENPGPQSGGTRSPAGESILPFLLDEDEKTDARQE